MGFTLTVLHPGNGVGLPVDHRFGFPEKSGLAPIVFVVDPDRAVCESLERLLQPEGWQVETFGSAEEFLAYPVEGVPGCLILDAALPGSSSLALQKSAAAKCPHIRTIFLCGKCDIPTTVGAMKAGAVEFLTKPFHDNELLSAVREALKRSRLALAKEAEKQTLQRSFASLSLRQQQVMALVSSGLLNKEVGGELGISEITVKAHRGQVMQKMNANSFADLIRMASTLGLSKRKEFAPLRREDGAANLAQRPLQRAGVLEAV
jgi:FixJ family two-component response regulator